MYPDLFTIPGIRLTVPSYGVTVMAGLLLATWWAAKRSARVKVNPDIALNLSFLMLIFGLLGGRLFSVLHHWDAEYAANPGQALTCRSGGMEFYGGFISAFAACLCYLLLKRLSIRLISDIVAPSLLLAMGIGRIACFLAGCCYGASCPANLPWAVRFPYASSPFVNDWYERQVTLPANLIFVAPNGISSPIPRLVTGDNWELLQKAVKRTHEEYKEALASHDQTKIKKTDRQNQQFDGMIRPLMAHLEGYGLTPSSLKQIVQATEFHSRPLHPVQIYSAIGPILLALLTSTYFYRRKRHGMVMVVGLGLYAVERFVEEVLRTDNPHDMFGLTVSQFISLAIIVVAIFSGLILQKLPMRSPRAIAWAPVQQKPNVTLSPD